MTRNIVSAEQAADNRVHGGYTFNAFPPKDHDGFVMVFGVIRLGDHAHMEIESGRYRGPDVSKSNSVFGDLQRGLVGKIVMPWHEWVKWRDLMDTTTPYRIAEIEKPTEDQLRRYVA